MREVIFGIVLFIFLVVWNNITFEKKGYKQGQIDAINGNIKYELVEQPDRTTKWKEIKENE